MSSFVNSADFDLLALDQLIDSYDYETDPVLLEEFRPIEEGLWALMQTYGEGVNDFGTQLTDHLRRTSLDGMRFLVDGLGFSEKAGRNFHAANLLQDLGKIHADYDPNIWALPHRPTDDERAEKRKHTMRGPDVLHIALRDASDALKDHPHVKTVIPAIMMFHHERMDGNGPYALGGDEFGQVIKAVCIIDAKDGDMIPRGHQNRARSEEETLERMRHGEKYQGAFDPDILDQYTAYRAEQKKHAKAFA